MRRQSHIPHMGEVASYGEKGAVKIRVLHLDIRYFGNLGFDVYIRWRNDYLLILRPFGPPTNPLKI